MRGPLDIVQGASDISGCYQRPRPNRSRGGILLGPLSPVRVDVVEFMAAPTGPGVRAVPAVAGELGAYRWGAAPA